VSSKRGVDATLASVRPGRATALVRDSLARSLQLARHARFSPSPPLSPSALEVRARAPLTYTHAYAAARPKDQMS